MRMQMIIKMKDNGCTIKHQFRTKREFDAFYEQILAEKHLYKCVWIEPVNQPLKRQRIDF